MRLFTRFVRVAALMLTLLLIPSFGCNFESKNGTECQYHVDCPYLCVEGRCIDLEGGNATSGEESGNMEDAPNSMGGARRMLGGSEAREASRGQRDCRNDGVGCTPPFECRLNASDDYECLESEDSDEEAADEGGNTGEDVTAVEGGATGQGAHVDSRDDGTMSGGVASDAEAGTGGSPGNEAVTDGAAGDGDSEGGSAGEDDSDDEQNGTQVQEIDRGPAELFGAALSDDVEFIDLAALISDPETFANRTLQTEGIIRGVCQRRGCWMELRTEENTASESITVKFLDYGFFVPTDSRGAFVRVEGVPDVQVLTAEQVEELLEEGYDPGIVREDGTAVMFRLMASGVMMWNRED